MSSKPFDRELYVENNTLAVKTVAEMLSQRGNIVKIPEEEQYKSHDFTFINQSGKEYRVEVERKKVWRVSGEWQGWSTVDIPYRKLGTRSDYFSMINEPCDTLLIIPMSKVLSSQVVIKNTIYTKAEKFFSVPIEEFILFTREGDEWV